ncbi:hypothetical protein W97_02190 [Coniosporium apollinis CBS 100218]|uniref:Large ribosomal subunit protein bL27m n=1 Tax=Coniosporium apollinis (strain CBS 100218) TaxID=1168221 RepID=R7YMC1_CONA1|nr:uncharacterized protein W97_02190 [Coniosporium apollinis CBS 100218]EON62964.1 hypothetical protein W97_02190 [Coniosporium apollinis CBS 100218]
MLLPRLCAPTRAAFAASRNPHTTSSISNTALEAIRCSNAAPATTILSFVRHATHQSEGRANGPKDGPGKRLGAKKTGEQYVIPGNIIFRQRGTLWFPGENCDIGRDHTIFATQPGYVKYYKDPLKHPKRQYIGVVFERHQTLPVPPNAARRRRLGMLAVKREDIEEAREDAVGDLVEGANSGEGMVRETPREDKVPQVVKTGNKELVMRPGYMYREANWQIGRAAEKKGVKVNKFDRGDRFTAWRKRNARKERNAESRRLRTKKK